MLIEVTKKHITEGQDKALRRLQGTNKSPLARGNSCPVARAIADQFNLRLVDIYVGPDEVRINWLGGLWRSNTVSVYKVSKAMARFIADADMDDNDGWAMDPCVLELRQEPTHVP